MTDPNQPGEATEPFSVEFAEDWLPSNLRQSLRKDASAEPGLISRTEGHRRRNTEGVWKVHGEVRSFDQHGTLRFRANYRDNISNGLSEWFSESGRKQRSGTYRDGAPEGVFEAWHETGIIQSRSEWRNRKQVGANQMFYESGKLKHESHTDDQGRNVGVTIGWREDGSELYRTTYRDGRDVHNIEFTDDDAGVRSIVIRINEGTLIVQKPATPKQRIFMIGLHDDFERMIELPKDDPPEE